MQPSCSPKCRCNSDHIAHLHSHNTSTLLYCTGSCCGSPTPLLYLHSPRFMSTFWIRLGPRKDFPETPIRCGNPSRGFLQFSPPDKKVVAVMEDADLNTAIVLQSFAEANSRVNRDHLPTPNNPAKEHDKSSTRMMVHRHMGFEVPLVVLPNCPCDRGSRSLEREYALYFCAWQLLSHTMSISHVKRNNIIPGRKRDPRLRSRCRRRAQLWIQAWSESYQGKGSRR